jgi:hypothetical protein
MSCKKYQNGGKAEMVESSSYFLGVSNSMHKTMFFYIKLSAEYDH